MRRPRMTRALIGFIMFGALASIAAWSVAPSVGLYWLSNADPTVSPGVQAPRNQLLIRTDSPSLYYKSGAASTAWTQLGQADTLTGFATISDWCEELDGQAASSITEGHVACQTAGGACTNGATGDAIGLWTLSTSTSATGTTRAATSLSAYSFTPFGYTTVRFYGITTPILDDGTEKFDEYIGFGDTTNADQADGCYFISHKTSGGGAAGTASDKWQIECSANSVHLRAALDGINTDTLNRPLVAGDNSVFPPTGEMNNFAISCTIDRCDFYMQRINVDSQLLHVGSACTSGCTIAATSIPPGTATAASARTFGILAQIVKWGGTTARTMNVDAICMSRQVPGEIRGNGGLGPVGFGVVPPATLQQEFFDPNATGNPPGGVAHSGHPTVKIRFPSTFGASPTTPRPLYVFLHPYESTASAQTFQTDYGFGTVEDDQNALSLAPLGEMDTSNDRFWNASGGCCDLDGTGHNDITYLGNLISQVIAAGWPVDRARVYLIGASNGGFMASRFASERPDLVTALWMSAGGAASTSAIGGTDAVYNLAGQKIAVLESHGTGDGSIAYNGGTFGAMPVPYPSVEGAAGSSTNPTTGGTIRQWLDANICGTTFTAGSTFDYDSAVGGNETTVYDSVGCPAGGAVEHWKMAGSAHSPTYTASARTAAIAWLEAHHRSS